MAEPWKQTALTKAFIDGTNVELRIRKVRLSFPHLFKPQARTDKQKKITGYAYNGAFLIPKDRADCIKLIQDAQREAIRLKWGEQAPRIGDDRRALKDGEPRHPDTGERTPLYDGYAGCVVLSANKGLDLKPNDRGEYDWKSVENPVQLLDSRKNAENKFPRLKESDGKLYAGCYVDLIARLYGYDGKKENPDRVSCSLEAVKFVSHGDAFGARKVDADSAFEEEEDEELAEERTASAAGRKVQVDDEDASFLD